MVKPFIKKLVILFILVAVNPASFASPQLFFSIYKDESTLGRPVRAELYGISLNSKITEVDLNKLNEYFGVVTDYVINDAQDKRWPNKTVQILKLKLYPRKTGELFIPQLSINGAKTKKKNIYISEGETSLPEVRFSSQNFYERQQITTHVLVVSTDSNSRLSIKKEHNIPNFNATPLPFKRTKTDKGKYILQIGWSISALKSGRLLLDLPPIEYSVSGVSRKQFYLPVKTLDITPLPSYLPPTLPVGRISIKSVLPDKYSLKADSLSYWTIKINGHMNKAYSLPPILRQIKSNTEVSFLPANTVRSIKATENNLISSAQYSIPFKPLRSGFLRLPELYLQYFDHDSKKIISITHKEKVIFVLSEFWRGIIIVLIIALFIYLVLFGYDKWLKYKHSRMKRKQALILLEQGRSIDKTREAMRLLAEAEDWPKNITLQQWAAHWKSRYKTDDDFENTVHKLSLLFYSSDEKYNIMEQNKYLLNIIYNKNKR